MEAGCRNALSFTEQYCSITKISRIKTTASFKIMRALNRHEPRSTPAPRQTAWSIEAIMSHIHRMVVRNGA